MTGICATVVEVNDEGHRRLQFSDTPDISRELDRLAKFTATVHHPANRDDMAKTERYQTIMPGPTFGRGADRRLAFHRKLLDEIRARGVTICLSRCMSDRTLHQ